jgi:hypothetical protein
MHGYFDDSGTHAQAPLVVLAGFLATVDRWQSFNKEWAAALKEYGLDYFHMADFAGPYREYQNWDSDSRRTRLDTLLTIVKSHAMISVGIGIPKAAFDSYMRGTSLGLNDWPSRAYSFAALMLMDRVATRFEQVIPDAARAHGFDVWVSYRFEDGTQGKGEILDAYDIMKSSPELQERSHVLSVGFEPKKQVLPLQAADIVAYELYRDFTRKDTDPERVVLSELSQIPNMWYCLDDADMQRMGRLASESSMRAFRRVLEERGK